MENCTCRNFHHQSWIDESSLLWKLCIMSPIFVYLLNVCVQATMGDDNVSYVGITLVLVADLSLLSF